MSGGISKTGSIRGFNVIDLGQNQTPESITPTNFSLTDLMCRIEDIYNTYDPDALNDLITMILTHIQSENNPHQVTLSEVGGNIFNAVYQQWLAQGNTGTLQDFYNVFFQVVDITTVSGDGVLTGSPTSIITVSAANALIAQHNSDPNAHTELLDIIIPGNPPSQLPTTSFNAQFGAPLNSTTTRSTPINVVDRNGNLYSVAANIVAIDNTTGIPAFPIYEARTNLIFPSDPTLQPTSNLLGCTNSLSPAGTLKVAPDGNVCMVLTESTNNELHGYKIGISLTDGVEYTDSVFIYPLSSQEGITLYLDIYPEVGLVLDLNNYTVTTGSSSIVGYAYPFPNGWIRIGIQYVANTTGNANLIIATTPATSFGTNPAYQGTFSLMFGIFGLQHVAGCGVSPYIPTTTSVESCDSTEITITVNLGNASSGLLGISHNHPPTMSTATRSLISLSQNLIISVLNNNVEVVSESLDGTSVFLQLPDIVNEPVTTAFSYSPTLYKLGNTGSSKISEAGTAINLTSGNITIKLGSTVTPFNGNIYSFVIYPVSDTDQQIEFLVGES